MAHVGGLVAAKKHPSPVAYCDMVPQIAHRTLRGPRAEMIPCKLEGVSATERAVFSGPQGRPLIHMIVAQAVALREAMKPAFAEYARQVIESVRVIEETRRGKGLRLVSGGTDDHLLLVDLRPSGAIGKEEELEMAVIAVYRNLTPLRSSASQTNHGHPRGRTGCHDQGSRTGANPPDGRDGELARAHCARQGDTDRGK